MTFREFLELVKADHSKYTFARWYMQPGFWVGFSYRLRRFRKLGPSWARLLLPLDVLVGSFRRVCADTRIPHNAVIGPGLLLVHARGIRISGHARLGSDLRLFHQVTIGEWKGTAPQIGNNVSIFSGAKLFGPITIGDRVRIGPNAVVASDIPDDATVQTAPFTMTMNPQKSCVKNPGSSVE